MRKGLTEVNRVNSEWQWKILSYVCSSSQWMSKSLPLLLKAPTSALNLVSQSIFIFSLVHVLPFLSWDLVNDTTQLSPKPKSHPKYSLPPSLPISQSALLVLLPEYITNLCLPLYIYYASLGSNFHCLCPTLSTLLEQTKVFFKESVQGPRWKQLHTILEWREYLQRYEQTTETSKGW